jgi:flavin-dependent dehydrogenase
VSQGAPHDVAVVGAGPAGSATALLLGQSGFDVVLCDAASFPRDKVCGDSVSPGAWPVLRRLGVAEEILRQRPQPLRGMRVVAPEGSEFRGDYPDGARGFALRRRIFDNVLLEAARAAGVRVREGTRVAGVDRAEGAPWRAVLDDGADLRARLLVLADGRRGLMARGRRATADLRARPRFAARGYWRGVAGLEARGEMHVGAGGYCGVAPLGLDEANVTFVLDQAAFRPARGGLEAFYRAALRTRWPRLHARLEGASLTEPPRAVGPLLLSSPRSLAGGALVLGDAAGTLDPFTGEGVALALRGAALAADAAARALREGTDGAVRAYGQLYRRDTRSTFRVNRLILALADRPWLADAVARRLSRRPALACELIGMAGGLRPVREVLAPGFLWSLLRP